MLLIRPPELCRIAVRGLGLTAAADPWSTSGIEPGRIQQQ
jgi:hypothetical protein